MKNDWEEMNKLRLAALNAQRGVIAAMIISAGALVLAGASILLIFRIAVQ